MNHKAMIPAMIHIAINTLTLFVSTYAPEHTTSVAPSVRIRFFISEVNL